MKLTSGSHVIFIEEPRTEFVRHRLHAAFHLRLKVQHHHRIVKRTSKQNHLFAATFAPTL